MLCTLLLDCSITVRTGSRCDALCGTRTRYCRRCHGDVRGWCRTAHPATRCPIIDCGVWRGPRPLYSTGSNPSRSWAPGSVSGVIREMPVPVPPNARDGVACCRGSYRRSRARRSPISRTQFSWPSRHLSPAGVGITVNILTTRLGRIVDRARVLSGVAQTRTLGEAPAAEAEMTVLSRRARLIYRAIALSITCALSVCLTVTTLLWAPCWSSISPP